jgi:peptidoglycan-associated lipoprotein
MKKYFLFSVITLFIGVVLMPANISAQEEEDKLEFIIKGKVTDFDTKKPIEGAKIILKGSDGSVEEIITPKKGNYKFETNPNSKERYIKRNTTYTLSVSKVGYTSYEVEETTEGADASTTFEQNFALKKEKK